MVIANEIEQSVLGTILTDEVAFDEIRELLNADHFNGINREVFAECLKHEVPDMIILADRFDTALLSDYVTMASPRYLEYCQILIEKKIIRDVVRGAGDILRVATETDPYALADMVSALSDSIGHESADKHSLTPSEIRERDKEKPKAEKVLTGQARLDEGILSNGMKRGQVVLTVADSGHGKTQCALFFADLLIKQGYKIAWFQLEGYDSETAERFQSDDIFICDGLYDIEHIKRECKRLKRKHGVDYIVFDYVQNIECNQAISKTERVEYISKQIQKMAKELNCICNPLSQVTIEGSRTGWDQEPRYNDVRWSKQLKQDADLIISVFRPSRINSLVINDQSAQDWQGNPVPYNSVFLKQAKVRHGIQEWKRVHLIHKDNGLQFYTNLPF